MIALSVNGKTYNLDVEDDTPLLWVLRDTMGLTGTKYGCGIAQCGACTVLVDGVPTRSCQVPAGGLAGRTVTTIEALAQNGQLHPVQQAWIDEQVPQCGYCQNGMIIAAVDLLKRVPQPSLEEIKRAYSFPNPHLCRCGTYAGVTEAILAASARAPASVRAPARRRRG